MVFHLETIQISIVARFNDIFLSCIFVLFMYRHLTTLKLQRLYEDFHKEAPADLLAHLGSLDVLF